MPKKALTKAALRRQIASLKAEVATLTSFMPKSMTQRGDLPAPRFELVYEQGPQGNWEVYDVIYCLIVPHLMGQYTRLVLEKTQITRGGAMKDVEPDDLPIRAGCHAAHDGACFELPVYKVMPGRAPEWLDFTGYPDQVQKGRKHRTVNQ